MMTITTSRIRYSAQPAMRTKQEAATTADHLSLPKTPSPMMTICKETFTDLFANLDKIRVEPLTAGTKYRMKGLAADNMELAATLQANVVDTDGKLYVAKFPSKFRFHIV